MNSKMHESREEVSARMVDPPCPCRVTHQDSGRLTLGEFACHIAMMLSMEALVSMVVETTEC